ncbi:hypothetical protein MASR2M15_03510 [Anaerolineales bacterium]
MFENRNNLIIGLILLVALLVLLNPATLPKIFSDTIEFFDESVPCAYLPTANNRSAHQSVIARNTKDSLSLTVRTSTIPVTNEGEFIIKVIMKNNSIGTIPIYYNENQIVKGDDGSNGLSIQFSPVIVPNIGTRPPTDSFPETDIHLLGPRQSCVHTERIGGQLIDKSVAAVTVKATYRMTSPGQAFSTNPAERVVFTDQGMNILSTGLVESAPVQAQAIINAAAN